MKTMQRFTAWWKRSWNVYLIAVALSFIPLFVHLGTYPIGIWDESRLAVSSYEMLQSGNYLVTTFEGTRDEWNTKPPLLVWLQVLSFSVLGVSEFAFRLPSALAGLGIFLGILYFFRRTGQSALSGILAVLLLVISPRFVGFHALRTGDYEALLILCLTMQVVFFYLHLTATDRVSGNKYLNLMLVFVVLGGLTKSVNGLFFLPAFGLWWLITRKWTQYSFLRVAGKSLVAIGLILAFYLIREMVTPGYMAMVWENDLGGRMTGSILQDGFNNAFYWELFVIQTGGWVYFTGLLIIPGLILASPTKRKLLFYILTCWMAYYAVIHVSSTNTIWYNLALLPLMAIITAISAEVTWLRIIRSFAAVRKQETILKYALFIPLVIPYINTVNRTIRQTEVVDQHESFYAVTNFLRDQIDQPPKQNWIFYSSAYSPHNWWYIMRLRDKGHEFSYTRNTEVVESMDTILVQDRQDIRQLDSLFDLDTILIADYSILVRK